MPESSGGYTHRLPPIGKAPFSVGLGNSGETSDGVPLTGPVPHKRRHRRKRAHHPNTTREHENENDSDTM